MMKWISALCLIVLCALPGATLLAQQPAASTETPSSPFFIKSTWIVGGTALHCSWPLGAGGGCEGGHAGWRNLRPGRGA